MANQRKYNSYDRTKLARNKYGVINNYTSIGGTTYYDNNNQVGSTMVDLKEFRGATRTEDGVRGIVPAPLAGMNTWFLQGSGGWTRIPAFDWITEFPESDGLEKSGIQVNGDLNVTDTLTTWNLEVQGAAHFFSLIVDEVKAQGGQVLVSPSMFKVDYAGEYVSYNIFAQNSPLIELLAARTDIYNILRANDVEIIRCRRLYQRCDDGTMAIENECQIGDMLRCRQLNIKAGEYRNVSNTDYWSFVCNTGEGEYTNEDGITYPAFWVDLAFTLRKSDGHNIPLGSTLYLDGSTPSYPDGFKEIEDALELKRVSQETWDGTRNVDDEFFENEEWTNIQETVIKVRGLDDQVQDITGKGASDYLYDNDKYLAAARDYLDIALNGGSSSAMNLTTMSTRNAISMIQTGIPNGYDEPEPTGLQARQLQQYANAINGDTGTDADGLIISRQRFNKIPVAKDTVLERQFIVADDVVVYDEEAGHDVTIYHEGEVLSPGTDIVHDVNLVDIDDKTDIDKNVGGQVTPVTETEANVINNFTEDTQTGVNRDSNEWMYKDYSVHTEWAFGYVGYYPDFRIKDGDALACLGHLYDGDRQNAIVLSSTNPIDPELEAPAMAQYSHIDIFGKSISKFRQTAIAANGNEFIGSFLVNYNNTYVDINERINMMIMDVTTGLEAVGIHLDGENSTITLVGSVDLRQHSQDSYDSLNLYDNLGVKRVEITPFDIPKRGEATSQIDNGKYNFTSITERKTAPSSYIKHKAEWWDWKLFHTTHKYTLQNFLINMTTSTNIGYLDAGYELDLRDLQLKLNMPAYLVGSIHATDRGLGKQEVTSFTFSLKKNGVSVPGFNLVPITNYQTSGLNTDTANFYAAEIMNDYTIQSAGTYTVEVNIGIKAYAYIETDKEYNNYYFSINCNLTGSVSSGITRTQTGLGTNYNGYKFTIGTNGFELAVNNSRHIYAANDAIELQWDNNYITMDDTKGLCIRKDVVDVYSSTQLGIKSEIIFCHISNNSYKVTLPDPSEFGLFRTITILGWISVTGNKLTVAAKGDSYIELQVIKDIGVKEIDFKVGSGCPMQALTLMATGANTWRIISYV